MEQMKQIPVYRQTGMYAREHGELEQFRQSNVANIACRIITDIHRIANFQNRYFFFLAGINRSRKLRIAEAVEYAMVTDAVSASKIFMCRIIKHHPLEDTRMRSIRSRLVHDPCVAEGMFLTV